MLNISELGTWLEEIDTWFIVIFAILEVGIDLVCRNQRNYRDTIANVAISLVYALTNTVLVMRSLWVAYNFLVSLVRDTLKLIWGR
jgi:hypothetical protein